MAANEAGEQSSITAADMAESSHDCILASKPNEAGEARGDQVKREVQHFSDETGVLSKPCTEGGCALPDCLCIHCGGVRAAAGGVIVPCTQGGDHCFCMPVAGADYCDFREDIRHERCCWCEEHQCVRIVHQRVLGHGPHKMESVDGGIDESLKRDD